MQEQRIFIPNQAELQLSLLNWPLTILIPEPIYTQPPAATQLVVLLSPLSLGLTYWMCQSFPGLHPGSPLG